MTGLARSEFCPRTLRGLRRIGLDRCRRSGAESEHLPEEIAIQAFLKQRLQSHPVGRHGPFSRLRLVLRNPANLHSDHDSFPPPVPLWTLGESLQGRCPPSSPFEMTALDPGSSCSSLLALRWSGDQLRQRSRVILEERRRLRGMRSGGRRFAMDPNFAALSPAQWRRSTRRRQTSRVHQD
jgi:hypothetical protein